MSEYRYWLEWVPLEWPKCGELDVLEMYQGPPWWRIDKHLAWRFRIWRDSLVSRLRKKAR